MKQDLISVVVPVYNVEKYLCKCVDSILNQTYQNLEIFLVDDGSLDNSGRICDEYAKKDNRIIAIHKSNGGLSDARNVAIEQATGKYITFIDSDDYVSLDMIEFLHQNVTKYQADISTCMYRSFCEKQAIDTVDQGGFRVHVFDAEQALETMLYQKECTTSAWGKLYLTKLFKNIRYPFGKICEDLDTTYLLFSKAKKIVISNCKKYYYLQRADSIINSKFNEKRMDALEFAKKETLYVQAYYPKITKSAINREFMEAIFILCQFDFKNKKYNNYYIKLKETIKRTRKTVIFDYQSRFLYRIYAIATFLGYKNFTVLLRWMIRLKGV